MLGTMLRFQTLARYVMDSKIIYCRNGVSRNKAELPPSLTSIPLFPSFPNLLSELTTTAAQSLRPHNTLRIQLNLFPIQTVYSCSCQTEIVIHERNI